MILAKSPIDNMRGLRENLLKLRKGASPGTGGLRPEFLVSCGKEFSEAQMLDLENFAMRHGNGELPGWWYSVWPSVQTVALYKDEEQDKIRPLGIRNPLIKAIHQEVINGSKEKLVNFLEPQQLGMSQGEAAKLVHAVRMLAESRNDFIVPTNDCRKS